MLIGVLSVFALWFVGGILLPARYGRLVGPLIVIVAGFGAWLLWIGSGEMLVGGVANAWGAPMETVLLGAAVLLIVSGVGASFLVQFARRRQRASRRTRWLGLGLVILLGAAGCTTYTPVPGYQAAYKECKAEVGPYRPVGEAVAGAISPLLLPFGMAADRPQLEAIDRCMERRGFTEGAVVRVPTTK